MQCKLNVHFYDSFYIVNAYANNFDYYQYISNIIHYNLISTVEIVNL